jgi:hypothetical protein
MMFSFTFLLIPHISEVGNTPTLYLGGSQFKISAPAGYPDLRLFMVLPVPSGKH